MNENVLDKHNEDLKVYYAAEKLEEQKHIVDMLGMIDYKHYLEYKERAINGLMIFGSKFQEALGMALSEADDTNSVKIIHTWKNECSVHEMLYKMHIAKQVAEEPIWDAITL